MNPGVLAFDIGGTKLAAAVVTVDGRIAARAQTPTPKADAEGVAAALIGIGRRVEAMASHVDLLAVGLGCAGPVDPRAGTVSPINIPGWRNFPLVATVRAAFSGRPVALAGDGHAMAVGEHYAADGRLGSVVLGMIVSTGVGGGIIIDGQLYTGSTGNAGHIGHIIVDLNGPPCACGSRGCVESLASGPSMIAFALTRGWIPNGNAEGPALAAAARAGDTAAAAAFDRAAQALAIGIVSTAAVLDLDDVVVGGGVANAADLLFVPLRENVARLAGLPFLRRIEIHATRLGGDAGLMGAAVLAIQASDALPAVSASG